MSLGGNRKKTSSIKSHCVVHSAKRAKRAKILHTVHVNTARRGKDGIKRSSAVQQRAVGPCRMFLYFFTGHSGKRENTPPTRDGKGKRCSAVSFFHYARSLTEPGWAYANRNSKTKKRRDPFGTGPLFFSSFPFFPYPFSSSFRGYFVLLRLFPLRYRIDRYYLVRRRQTRLSSPSSFDGLASRTCPRKDAMVWGWDGFSHVHVGSAADAAACCCC